MEAGGGAVRLTFYTLESKLAGGRAGLGLDLAEARVRLAVMVFSLAHCIVGDGNGRRRCREKLLGVSRFCVT